VNPGDELFQVFSTSGSDDLFLATRKGVAIRFEEGEVRPMGLATTGVNGIKLQEGDEVVMAGKIVEGSQIVMLDSTGKGWRLPAEEFPRQGRYGRGVSAAKLVQDTELTDGFCDTQNRVVMVEFAKGSSKSFRMDEISPGKRTKNGQELLKRKTGDAITGMLSIPIERKLTNTNKVKASGQRRKAKVSDKSSPGRKVETSKANNQQKSVIKKKSARQKQNPKSKFTKKPIKGNLNPSR